jgi:undecaprenyl-diphosphatase
LSTSVGAWEAAVLGLVEGLTEFLPVSSTGHLLVAEALLGMEDGEAAHAFAIVIQAGAILAVTALYPHRLRAMARGALGQDPNGRALLLNVLVAFLPAAVFGLLFDDAIEAWLFGPWPVVFAWAVGGVALLAARARTTAGSGGSDGAADALATLTPREALGIGLAQVVALWPGTSRSLMALVGGLWVGLPMHAAVEFSFLLGWVTLSAATAFKLLKSGDVLLAAFTPDVLVLGVLTATVSAFLSARWMVGWLASRGLGIFGVWRLIAAGATALWLVGGH